jgi:Na+/melibiose symporter-like transporter
VCTTYFSWRWVFAGEVVIVIGILALARKVSDAAPEARTRLDLLGAVLSAAGLGLAVYGVLRSGTWGWVNPREGGPSIAGLSPVVWLIVGGLVVIWLFLSWERHLEARGEEPLIRPSMLGNRQLSGGLIMFFIQYLVQMGLFFTIPLFLSISLGLSALETGARILPLSITLLLAAAGIPRFLPNASPRRVVRVGLLAMFAGIVALLASMDATASAAIVTVPLLLTGFGVGALASQLGAVTVSAVPDEQSPEVGGLQNTSTNLGASIGTALAGSILLAALTTSVLTGIEQNPQVPDSVKSQASVQLAAGAPFVSDADLEAALGQAGVTGEAADAILDVNAQARVDGLRAALFVLALIAFLGLFSARRVPTRPPSSAAAPAASGP